MSLRERYKRHRRRKIRHVRNIAGIALAASAVLLLGVAGASDCGQEWEIVARCLTADCTILAASAATWTISGELLRRV